MQIPDMSMHRQFHNNKSYRHSVIKERAKEIWEKSGKPQGCDEKFWLQAQDEIEKIYKTYVSKYSIAWNSDHELVIVPLLKEGEVEEQFHQIAAKRQVFFLLLNDLYDFSIDVNLFNIDDLYDHDSYLISYEIEPVQIALARLKTWFSKKKKDLFQTKELIAAP